ncbi:hypothetical protein TNCV_2608861 [Trichonephila clavipes]|uniref:Uncharacterized protein n=1 Tax=Trichonephila clavipes TaxID=2585209 RepID=A0A8X6VBC9_TRICX|nr:hypothetical protein TNCV_2608861 [Trichonephila clavipes]
MLISLNSRGFVVKRENGFVGWSISVINPRKRRFTVNNRKVASAPSMDTDLTNECSCFHAEIVEVEIGGVAIYRPFGEFRRAKSYCHLYGAQGQRQVYL